MTIDENLKNKIVEGKDDEAVTSPAQGQEEVSNTLQEDTANSIDLSSTPLPTQEEETAAGLNGDEAEGAETNEKEQQQDQTLEEEKGVVSGTATQMFTQSQVDEIAGKTRKEAESRTLKKVYSRYGVNSEEELDDLFGNAQRYDTLREEYDTDSKNYKKELDDKSKAFQELSEQVALLRSGIDENRFEDATFILRGKGLEVNLENIQNELATHPEWKKSNAVEEEGNEDGYEEETRFQKKPNSKSFTVDESKPTTRLSVLGNSGADTPVPELSERDIALKKIFKV